MIQQYVKLVATILVAVTTALTPFYGKDPWFIGLVAGAGALALAANSLLPSKSNAVQEKR